MAADPLSPIAPARVRVLVLPAGRIKRQRFMTFVERLQQESTVRLGDISPDGRPGSSRQTTGGGQLGRQSVDGTRIAMFAPMAFPNGALLYNLQTAMPPPSNLTLTPFELFREPVMVIGIADAKEYEQMPGTVNTEANGSSKLAKEELENVAVSLHEQYPKILVHQLLIMDCPGDKREDWIPEAAMCVPAQNTSRSTSLKSVMCDLSAKFLSELTTYAKAVQALPSIQSPGMSNGPYRPVMDRSVSLGSKLDSAAPGPDHLSRTMSASTSTLAQSRTSSPSNKPPTSFDEIATTAMQGSPLSRSVSRTEKDPPRAASRDRMSLQAFGSSNTAERARNKGKARVGIVIGNLYMMAGRWSDAWRELVENTNKSRVANDNLWYAKGLESVLVCMLLFVWAGYDFQIPAICYSGSDRPSSIIAPNGIKDGLPSLGAQEPVAAEEAAQRLAKILPDLVPTILGIFERASTLSGETIPPVAYSEGIIRKAKLMTLVHNANGKLTSAMVAKMVSGRSSSSKPSYNAGYATGIAKHNIAEILFKAYPPPNANVPLQDETKILAGIASVLSKLGLERKKAVVMKELVASLVPALVHARKVGAAEMGIHPAASLSAAFDIPISDQQSGLDSLLREIHSVYGARAIDPLKIPHLDAASADGDSGIEAFVDATISAATNCADIQAFGSLHLKIDILRACIDFCEALPDLAGIVVFAALLLRIAGPHSAVTPGTPGSRVKLATEEQIRLISNMSRTSNAANKVGITDIQVPYWDDFLVRNVQWYENAITNSEKLREHQKPEMDPDADLPKRSPFLYDPFAKHDSQTEEKVLVSGEKAQLVVTLQNPYDFDVKIEKLAFATEGVPLEAKHGALVLGPARIQSLPVTVQAREIGKMKIVGCIVKFVGCLDQVFPIYPTSWTAEATNKVKDLAIQPPTDRISRSISESLKREHSVLPTPFTLSSTVIQAQPHVVVEGTSLSESATMVLEGQRKTFQVMLRNKSTSMSVDFVHVSFDDSLTSSIRLALMNKELTRAETHELERQVSQDPVFTWARADSCPSQSIAPGERATFDITVLGRPGLGAAKIMFDYAYLGKPLSELQGRAYTRQVVVPVDITVNASVQLHRIDFAEFPSDFAWSNQHRQRLENKDKRPVSRRSSSRPAEKSNDRFKMLLDRVGMDSDDEEHCLVLLDLRNAWPNPLTVAIEVREGLGGGNSSGRSSPVMSFKDGKYKLAPVWKRAYTVHEVIHPGHIARLVLLLPKIQIANPYAPIPLEMQHQRQFVVSADRVFSPDFEMATREQFWFKEEVLKYMRGSWKEEGSPRQGTIDLRGIRLKPRMIDLMRLQDVDVVMSVVSAPSVQTSDTDPQPVTQLGRSCFQVSPESFLTLRTTITNRSNTPVRGVLRLQPTLAHQSAPDIALDIGRKLMISGLLQQPLPTIAPMQSVAIEVGVCPVVSGEFDIQALVEEMAMPEYAFIQNEEDVDGAQVDVNAGVRPDEDFSAGAQGLKPKERRIWRAGEACRLVVSDPEA